MTPATPMERIQEIAERASVSFDEMLEFLDSPAGRRIRRILAAGLILSVPLVMRVPGLRRSGIGRAIELVGGTALVIRLAEALRDWEHDQPSRASRVIVDVPPAG